jgi:transcription initiation factor TFIID TATA-box-binding protein
MTDVITIENIVVYARVADDLDIEQIAEKLPEFKYNPDEFLGLTLKLDDPKTAVLLLPSGKAVCTGAKKIKDAETAIKKLVDKIKGKKIKVKKNLKFETENIIASTDLEKELDLDLISKGLLLDNVDYEPEQFQGLIYRMDDIGASLLLFSSGKVVCTGTKKIEDATNAIEEMKEKLTSLGAL